MNDLESDRKPEGEQPQTRSRQPSPAVSTSNPSAQVIADKGKHSSESEIYGAQRSPATTWTSAIEAAPLPRVDQVPLATPPGAALPQVTAIDLALAVQAGEPPFKAPPTELVGSAGGVRQDREFSIPPADLTAVPVQTAAAIQPSTTRQRADQMPEPGRLQRMSPGTGPTHPYATGASTPSQAEVLTSGEPLAEAGWTGQATIMTIPGISERRSVSTVDAAADRDNAIPGGTSGVSPLAVSTGNSSAQIGADGGRHSSESEMDRAQCDPSTTRTGIVGAAPPPRLGPAPSATAPRTALLQVTPDDPPRVDATPSAYPSAHSAAEQIRTVAELAAQVGARRDLQPDGNSGGTPLPQFSNRAGTPRPPTPPAFWERSYLNRLYRWSCR